MRPSNQSTKSFLIYHLASEWALLVESLAIEAL
jgi:hypothetical protein